MPVAISINQMSLRAPIESGQLKAGIPKWEGEKGSGLHEHNSTLSFSFKVAAGVVK